ncbi:11084_t:CDS:2 [Funneliformis mosseae]|uniref:11084_t:CDS:1 n=1 Tax=Funneliformis mosseae TaxID=27381 RepID=A0A9N9ECX6_FUNMO|nr:11084_t:CDS:2 [Funneliformis mosseae]
MSDPLSILKGEIKRFSFVSNEKISLLAHFTKNLEKIAVAVSCLDDCDNDEKKCNYLRSLISTPEQGDFSNLDSLKNIVEEIVRNEVSDLDFKMEQGFNKVRRAIEASIYSPGTDLTRTDKGKSVMEKGAHIEFPFELTTSSKKSENGRFTNPPNRNADSAEKEIQQYFINECKELEKSPNIKNKLIVVNKHSSLLLGTRKPDFLFIPKGSHLNMLNVVAIGEIKK